MCGEKSPEDIEGKRDLDSPINIDRRFHRRQNSAEQTAIKSGLREEEEEEAVLRVKSTKSHGRACN